MFGYLLKNKNKMAKQTKTSGFTRTFMKKHKKRRRGVHAKSKTSASKGSKNYRKKYVGQG